MFSLLGLGLSFLYLKWKGDLYSSKATLELIKNPHSLVTSKSKTFLVSPEEARTHIFKIKSSALAESVVKSISLDHNLFQQTINSLKNNWKENYRNLNLSTILNDNLNATYANGVITINFTCPDDKIAPLITDEFAKKYVLSQGVSLSDLMKGDIEALKSDEERIVLTMNLLKDKMSVLSKAHPALNLGGSNEEGTKLKYLEAIVSAEKEVSSLESKLSQILPLIGDTNKLLNTEQISSYHSVNKFIEAKIKLTNNLQKTSVIYGPKHPKILELNKLLHQNELELKEAIKEAIASLEASWRKAKTNLEVARDRLVKFNESMVNSKHIQQEYERLRDDHNFNRTRLLETQSKMAQLKSIENKDFSPIRILSLSEGIVQSESPNKLLTYALGLSSAITSCFAISFALFFFQSKLIVADLSQFNNIALLAHLPKFDLASTRISQSNKSNLSKVEKYFDKIIASLFINHRGNSADRIYAIISSIPGEGKTFVASQLAKSFASRNEKVLLLEANFRHSNLSHLLGLKNSVGLKQYLTEDFELNSIINKTSIPSLFLIASGGNSEAAVQKLNSPKLSNLISELSKDFDRIIIDTAPVSLYGDTNFIIPHCDSVIIIAAENKVDTKILSGIITKLEHSEVNIAGIVANFVLSDDQYVTETTSSYPGDSLS